MSECYICGDSDSLMRRCRECNLPVCTAHRLPEKHNCPALLEGEDSEKWFDERFENVDEDRRRKGGQSTNQRVEITGSKESSNDIETKTPEEINSQSNSKTETKSEYETVEPETYGRGEVEVEYESSPDLNPDGSLKTDSNTEEEEAEPEHSDSNSLFIRVLMFLLVISGLAMLALAFLQ